MADKIYSPQRREGRKEKLFMEAKNFRITLRSLRLGGSN
jgi:hypothetical protein